MSPKTLKDYKVFKILFPVLLVKSGFKMKYLAERIGVSERGFHTKKKNNSFTVDEMIIILDIIWSDYTAKIYDEIYDEELALYAF